MTSQHFRYSNLVDYFSVNSLGTSCRDPVHVSESFLRVLSAPDLAVRRKTLHLTLDLVSSQNVEEMFIFLRKVSHLPYLDKSDIFFISLAGNRQVDERIASEVGQVLSIACAHPAQRVHQDPRYGRRALPR